jgi:hypothetical protein
MKIVAYTYFKSPESYETDVHCIDCHVKWARAESLRPVIGGNGSVRISASNLIEMSVTYFNGTVHDYAVAGCPVFEIPPIFARSSTMYTGKSLFDAPLVCADCKQIIST